MGQLKTRGEKTVTKGVLSGITTVEHLMSIVGPKRAILEQVRLDI